MRHKTSTHAREFSRPHVVLIKNSNNLSAEQRKQAALQDKVVGIIFGHNGVGDAVLHGGTAICRCFESDRFSPDIDLCSTNTKTGNALAERFVEEGLEVKKFKRTGNGTIFASVSEGNTTITLSVAGRELRAHEHIATYRCVDGRIFPVTTITPQSLIIEKMQAFQNRRKHTDMYDIYHLLNLLRKEDQTAGMENKLLAFVTSAMPPVDDHRELRSRVYSGRKIPDYNEMMHSIRKIAISLFQ